MKHEWTAHQLFCVVPSTTGEQHNHSCSESPFIQREVLDEVFLGGGLAMSLPQGFSVACLSFLCILPCWYIMGGGGGDLPGGEPSEGAALNGGSELY